MQAYVAAGFDEASFWRLTPRVYLTIMKGAEARARASVELAWLTAVLGRVEKMPSLDKLLHKPDGGKASGEMMQAEMRAMARSMPKRKWSEWRKQ